MPRKSNNTQQAVQQLTKTGAEPVGLAAVPAAPVAQKPMWIYFEAQIQIRDRLVGGYPKNVNAEEAMLRARGLEELIPEKVVPTDPEAVAVLKQAEIDKTWVGFKTTPEGKPYLEARNVKAMLKEGANVIKTIVGVTNLKSKLAERVFVEPPMLMLVDTPLSNDSRVVHAMTLMGPRTAIKKYDFCQEPLLTFTMRVLNDGVVNERILRSILEYGQENGLGADRSQDAGKYDLVYFKSITEPARK